jgi:hypothetical protein
MNATPQGMVRNNLPDGPADSVNSMDASPAATPAAGGLGQDSITAAREDLNRRFGGSWNFNGDFNSQLSNDQVAAHVFGAAQQLGWDDNAVSQVLGVNPADLQTARSRLDPNGYGTTTAGTPASSGLFNAMSVPAAAASSVGTIPVTTATGANPVVAGAGTSGSYNAATAATAGPVTAGAGTAQGYIASLANTAAPVVAGAGTAANYGATQAATAGPVAAGQAITQQATTQGYAAKDAQAALQGPANTYDGTQGTASTWTPGRQATVQGQVADIIKSGSELGTLAETRSKQKMNASGLLNSSIAVGAGQTALYDAALPIAQQDANTFAQSGQYNAGNAQQMTLANMQSKNQGLEFSAGAKNKVMADNSQTQTSVNLANAGETNKAAQFSASEANAGSKFNAQSAMQVSQFNVGKALEAGIINQEQANKMAALNAQFSNEASQFNTSQTNEMMKANLDRALQAGIVNQEQANKMNALNAQMSNESKAFTAQQANAMLTANLDRALQAGIVNQEQANKMNALNAQFANEASQFNVSQANDMLKSNLDRALQAGIINQDQANKMAVFNASESNKLATIQATLNADIAKFNASQSNDLTKLGMDSATKVELANIESSYKQLLQSQASASNLYTQTMQSIANILGSDTMDEAAKAAAVANLTGLLNGGLTTIGAIANLNLPELNFGGGTPAGTPAPTPAPTPPPGSGGGYSGSGDGS